MPIQTPQMHKTYTLLCVPLAKILNNSIERGIYPEKLKIAKIVPIFKSDDEIDTNDYRPISLLTCCLSLIEYLKNLCIKDFLHI